MDKPILAYGPRYTIQLELDLRHRIDQARGKQSLQKFIVEACEALLASRQLGPAVDDLIKQQLEAK